MTTPPEPTAPPPAPAPPPEPKPPEPPKPAPTAADFERMRATLDAEREARKQADLELQQLRASTQTDAEKAIAAARAEGKAEAAREASIRLAAAEFRALAAGRLANPEAAIAALDLTKLVTRSGEPDRKKIEELIDQLSAIAPTPPAPGHIPPGVRQPAPDGTDDWLRIAANRVRGT